MMPELTLMPRFAETDALGHINNTTLGVWFESARLPLFRIFVPDLRAAAWNVMLRHTEYDFLAELFYGEEVTIRSRVAKIGNSSITVEHEAWQAGKLAAKGIAVLVHFDPASKRKLEIPASHREQLTKFL